MYVCYLSEFVYYGWFYFRRNFVVELIECMFITVLLMWCFFVLVGMLCAVCVGNLSVFVCETITGISVGLWKHCGEIYNFSTLCNYSFLYLVGDSAVPRVRRNFYWICYFLRWCLLRFRLTIPIHASLLVHCIHHNIQFKV